jgi:hypothetical protein
VCIFGLLHALVLLPVLLSFIGPEPFTGRAVEDDGEELKDVKMGASDAKDSEQGQD